MPLSPIYNPKEFERKIYETWQNNGVGNPEKQLEMQDTDFSKPKVLFATTNKHKVRIFKMAWEKQGFDKYFDLLTLNDLPHINFPEVVETGESFAVDALTKAKEYAAISGLPTISQDRGFVFTALNWPGTDSKKAMFGDSDEYFNSLTEEDKLEFSKKLINQTLSKLEGKDREMYVIQALAIALPNGEMLVEELMTSGQAAKEPIYKWETSFTTFFNPNDLGHNLNEFGTWGELYEYYVIKMYPITPRITDFLIEKVSKLSNQGVGAKSTYSILMPPPNLTGELHAGHVFQHYLMDTLTRIHRQKGENSLWYPGVDHAGIQLEGVVDKLLKKEGKDPIYMKKHQSQEWLDFAWSKVNSWRNNQKEQSSILGDTPDYSRNLFTLDERANRMVNHAFVKYWEDDLIYKGSYLVNWSVGLQTALSDVPEDIGHETRIDPFVTFQYEAKRWQSNPKYNLNQEINTFAEKYLKPCNQWPRLKLGTVRIETKFTDLAVAMHHDKFSTYFNKSIFKTDETGFDESIANQVLEAIETDKIRVFYFLPPIESGELQFVLSDKIDPDFGTGIVKLTPGHDIFDYELYHKLVEDEILESDKIQTCIGRDGRLTEICGEFAGLTVEEGRMAVMKRLLETSYITNEINPETSEITDEEFKNITKQKQTEYLKNRYPESDIDWEYSHNVVICERSKTVVEPLISEEFFISYSQEIEAHKLDKQTKWQFNFRTQSQVEILNKILSGEKTIETRALNPEEPKHFSRIKTGDIVELTDYLNNKIYSYPIRKSETYDNLDSAFMHSFDFKRVLPNIRDYYTLEEVKVTYKSLFGEDYYNKIQTDGFVAVYLNERQDQLLDINIRKATTLDTSKLIAIHKQTFVETYPNTDSRITKEDILSINWEDVKNKWANSITDGSNIFVCEINSETQGFLIFSKNGGVGEIEAIYLSSSYQNKGIGTKLINFALNELKDCQYIRLEAAGYNKKAINFYNKLGFKLTNIKVKDYEIAPGRFVPQVEMRKYNKLNLKSLALEGIAETNFYSEDFRGRAINFVNNLHDWCISRDLTWGHKMPVWYCQNCNPEHKFVSSKDKIKGLIVSGVKPESCKDCQGANLVQEEKVLDTWFSSCLWPLSTLDYFDYLYEDASTKEKNTDFETYFPTSDLVSAREIFYAWIVRMIVLSKYFTGRIPFKNVVIHPTVLDENGRKMSKSLGNGLDVQSQIDKFSSDSLRLAMLASMIPNRNFRLGGNLADKTCEKYRNFGNKIWNVARFLETKTNKIINTDGAVLAPASMWILLKYRNLEQNLENSLSAYELSHSIEALYKFLWDDYADWYVEYLKTDETQIIFAKDLFRQFIITLSPYSPFETEALWKEFFGEQKLLAFEVKDVNWSKNLLNDIDTTKSKEFETVIAFIENSRSLRGLFAIDPANSLVIYTRNQVLLKYREFIRLVGKSELIDKEGNEFYTIDSTDYSYCIDIFNYIKDKEKEISRTQKLLEGLEKQINILENQLKNEKFLANAETEIIEEKKQHLSQRQTELNQHNQKIQFLQA